MMGLVKLSLLCYVFGRFSVWGWGASPALHLDILDEFSLDESFAGVFQVQGLHNESTAFLFQDSWRDVRAQAGGAERILAKLRKRSEFSVLVTLKQDQLNSGVLLSVHHAGQRYLELESCGQRSEIRLHFLTADRQAHTETFPYALADGRWHKLSLAVSSSHLALHIDCNRIYERRIETPFMDVPPDASVWLGQRNKAHGYFKGIMQDVELMLVPQGYLSQCPDLNNTCPTCKDFHSLVQKIMELQDVLAKTSSKLSHAEEKMLGLDGCYCERSCSQNGVLYRGGDGWTDGCSNCSCSNGTVQCEPVSCAPPQCAPDSAPAYVPGVCCRECQPVCLFRGRVYVEGDRTSVSDSEGNCVLFECRARSMQRVEGDPCPVLDCPEEEQINLTDRCCKVCPGHDFCVEAQGSICVENSVCVNLEAGACCSCEDGYRPLRDDSAYCHDIDECADGRHYCRENTECVNTPGSFTCTCHAGYIRVDDYSCTDQDECENGHHSCDPNAICFNTVGGHSCTCKPGYYGNGTVCTDIDECAEGFVDCDSRATCVNLPGWYHCECRDGYHDNGVFSVNGDSCEDIDECETGRHSCSNDTVCFNVDGGFDCHCPHGRNCSGDCRHDDKVKHNGQIWVLDDDRCSICSCQAGLVLCRRMVCDCDSLSADLVCCPECDPRARGRCVLQDGLLTYDPGDTWVQGCQQCQCMGGQVDCWPVTCAPVQGCDPSETLVPEGECCPRCGSAPCQADLPNDLGAGCVDERGVARHAGAAWTKHGSECTLCQCKNGHVCCSVDPLCL